MAAIVDVNNSSDFSVISGQLTVLDEDAKFLRYMENFLSILLINRRLYMFTLETWALELALLSTRSMKTRKKPAQNVQ